MKFNLLFSERRQAENEFYEWCGDEYDKSPSNFLAWLTADGKKWIERGIKNETTNKEEMV